MSPCSQLYLDDTEYELPELEGVVILNINSWSAGCCMWDDSKKDGMGVCRYVYRHGNFA